MVGLRKQHSMVGNGIATPLLITLPEHPGYGSGVGNKMIIGWGQRQCGNMINRGTAQTPGMQVDEWTRLPFWTFTSRRTEHSSVSTATPHPGGFKCFTCQNAADNYDCNRWAPDVYCPQGTSAFSPVVVEQNSLLVEVTGLQKHVPN